MEISAAKIENIMANRGAYKATSFRGSGSVIGQEVTKQILNDKALLGKIPRTLIRVGKNDGEIFNSFVTAIGTAIIAPLFIAFNPFSKEDKDTKVYSAWRQPISAVLALLAQVGINMKFNDYMNLKASTGQFESANLKAQPVSSYLKRIIKLRHPEYTKDAIQAAISVKQARAKRKEVAAARELFRNKPIADEMLIDCNMIKNAREEVEKLFKDDIAKLGKKEAKDFIETQAKKLAIKKTNVNLIREANKKFVIRKLAKSGKSLDEAIEFIGNRCDMLLKKNKTHPRARFYSDVMTKLLDIKEYEQLHSMKDFSSVKDIGKSFMEILHNVKVKQYVEANIVNAKAVLKNNIKIYGIIVSLITLPFSCGLLNWSYPRIMEKIMPHAHKHKHHPPIPPQDKVEIHHDNKKEVKA